MIEDIAAVHMTDNDVSNNFAAMRENVGNGVEVVVEKNHRPVADPFATAARAVTL